MLCLTAAMTANPLWAQVQVNYEKYPDYSPIVRPDYSLGIEHSAVSRARAKQTRPARVNNAENKYFPPIFNQDGGSCGSASRIGYMFNYEMSAYRDLDSRLEENQYPTHFTWLLTNSNSGKDAMAVANGVPNAKVYGGRTYSRLFGNQDTESSDFGWMQGYDKWYSAMLNRISSAANFPLSVETEEGREAVKNWLWNHNGDTDFHAGGICGIGVASGGINYKRIPDTQDNKKNGVVGMQYVQDWGPSVDHALTIVGYDDRIEFDLDGNGKAGEKDKDEVGAWIIANSWGAGWADRGFIYCPYNKAVPSLNSKDYYMPEVYHVRKNYRPLRTFKIKMSYSKRSELRISGGIAANLKATSPERTTQFEHFKFAGDGDGNGVDAEVPMLGRWADGIHYEPMEFGYDMTDLSKSFDTRKPLKYFLVIESKGTANGNGKVHACSLIDYEFIKDGFEVPFNMNSEGVSIQTKGNRTIISVVVPGEPLNAPRNLALSKGTLSWNAPTESAYVLQGYNVYCNGEKVADLKADQTNYTAQQNGSYEIEAIYDVNGVMASSMRVGKPATDFAGSVPTVNKIKQFTNSGFEIVDLMKKGLEQMTMEFWINPKTVINWNQTIGPGWGQFMLHTTNAGELVVGWNEGQRITSAPGTLKVNTWAHVAVVVDKGAMTAYVNGKKVGSIFTSYSGINGFGSLQVGRESGYGMNGSLDEFRVWNYARTEKQVQGYMFSEIQNPASEPGLMANVRMDGANGLTDATGHYKINPFGKQTEAIDNLLFKDNRVTQAVIGLPTTTNYVGNEIQLTDKSTGGVVEWEWTVEGTADKTFRVANPVVVFDQPGTYNVSLKVTDALKRVRNTSKTIKIEAQNAPVAQFRVGAASVPANQPVSLINETEPGAGYKYSWSMPGAKVEQVNTMNAMAEYAQVGTYDVTLTVTNATGSHSVTKQVVVTEIAPEAKISVSPQIVLKGETVNFKDESSHTPEYWMWNIENEGHCIQSFNQNQSLEMKHPGVYSANLIVHNKQGGDTISQERAVVVCNADGKNGLNFTGGNQYVELKNNPIADKTENFTIEWWMYAKSNTSEQPAAHRIGNDSQGILLETMKDGRLYATMQGQVSATPENFISLSQWHHYAVVFRNGTMEFYKDAQLIGTNETGLKNYISPKDKDGTSVIPFCLGSTGAPMNAVIDEFRVWNTALDAAKLVAYANNEIADVKGAMSKDGLSVYYQFNQSSGDVQDATTNGNTGKRINFGPDGDAWSTTKGIFCLSSLTPEDCTADYLTNYQMPFKDNGKIINEFGGQRFFGLEEGTAESAWILENKKSEFGGTIITGFHVDKLKGDCSMTLVTEWDRFSKFINDHKAYQYVTLPKGRYCLSVENHNEFNGELSNLVVADGKGLPNTNDMASGAKAYTRLTNKKLNFNVEDDTEDVSLGIVANLNAKSCIRLKHIKLERKLLEVYGTPTTDMDCEEITQPSSLLQVTVSPGSITIVSDKEQHVRIVSISGITCFNGSVQGTKRISLAKGVYIVNGKKVMVY